MNNTPNLVAPAVLVAAVLLLDLYAYQAVRALTGSVTLRLAYWAALLLMLALPVIGMVFTYRAGGAGTSHVLLAFISLFAAAVAVVAAMALPLLAEDVLRLAALPVRCFAQKTPALLPRAAWVSAAALALGGAMLLAMAHGMAWGKHAYKLHRHTVYFSDLPPAFSGFRILHLSDFHAGSFTSARAVQRGVDLAKAQRADLLVFSGDMVNNVAEELTPWIPYLAQLEAPYGKYAVLGNHDYGDYHRWRSREEKAANVQALVAGEAEAGLRVLLDESVTLEKDGQQLVLVGVQNIGMGMHFVAYGSLPKALSGVEQGAFKILLSHDPSHWDKQVSRYPDAVQLTLAGHTHGFQFGVECRAFRWSPVQWVYPHWAGLYERNGRYLYVNRGFGFIPLFLGRVGVRPEVAVIELRRKE